MELRSVLEYRKSVRKFRDAEIPKEDIMDILSCGALAPSERNRQPWQFCLFKGDKKDWIALTLEEQFKLSRKFGFKLPGRGAVEAIRQAQVLIGVYRDRDEDNDFTKGDFLSIGACIENMNLRAVDLGYGALWIGGLTYCQEYMDNLVLDGGDREFVCALALGIPEEEHVQRTKRKDLSNSVEWYE